MNIDFNKNSDGLVPAIIQDATTKNVLMLGYMNAAAFKKQKRQNELLFTRELKNVCGPKEKKVETHCN